MNLDFSFSKYKIRVKALTTELLDLIFPRECLLSGTPIPSNNPYRYLLPSELQKIHWVSPPHCQCCGYPFYGELQKSRLCPHCEDLNPLFEQGKTAFLLKEGGRKLIHELKYHQGFHLWPDVEKLIKKIPEYLKFIENSILVPVPLSAKKQHQRGFNQSLFLAKILSKSCSRSTIYELIRRVKHTKTQTRLTRKERKLNVKNAFALSPKVVINSSLTYTLVDDVFTTGATLNACAAVLKKNGARKIQVITLGHG